MTAPAARQLEAEADDAAHLGLGVGHRVVGRSPVRAVMRLTSLAEVDAAGELSHDEHVHALDEVASQRRRLDERGFHGDRTQVGVEPEHLADTQEPLLGTHRCRRVVPLGPAHRTEQHGVRREQHVEVLVPDRCPVGIDGDAAGEHIRPLEREAEAFGGRIEHDACGVDDLRADAVTGDASEAVGRHPGSRHGRDSVAAATAVPAAASCQSSFSRARRGRPPGRPR